MPDFKIRATMTVTYIYEVEADTIEGQMGWNQWGKD
jgi:hypothetical protein